MNQRILDRVRRAATTVARRHREWGDAEVLRRAGLPGLALSPSREVAALATLNSTLLLEAALQVRDRLSMSGVPHFFAKGVALLDADLYRHGERTLTDIDFYVIDGYHGDAIRSLESMGYEQLPDMDQSGPREMRSASAFVRRRSGSVSDTQLDMHVALDPLDRLLPRPDRVFLPNEWTDGQGPGDLPQPHPAGHACILLHQIVHNDLLQFHTVVDLALVAGTLDDDGREKLRELCSRFRLMRALGLFDALLDAEFDVRLSTGSCIRDDQPSGFTLEGLLSDSVDASFQERASVTMKRIRTRARILDGHATGDLLRDALLPPAEFLRWRWRGPLPFGYSMHAMQLLRKAMGF